MLKAPQTEVNALWKKRYRSKGLRSATLARRVPARGIAINAISGTRQISAWDVSSGTLRQLTHSQEGVFTGTVSPDGRSVYYLRDEGGSESGHYVRLPWDGGEAQDLTPDMPAYAALYRCAVSEDLSSTDPKDETARRTAVCPNSQSSCDCSHRDHVPGGIESG